MLRLRVLASRLRQTGALMFLRLTGLVLAALVAGAVPTFVTATMEQVLQKQLQARPEPLGVVLAWTSPDGEDHGQNLANLSAYLTRTFPAAAGIAGQVGVALLPSGGQRPVQQVQDDGLLRASRRYFALGAIPAGLAASAGRLPAPGAPEVVLAEEAMAKAGYHLGEKLRVPLTDAPGGPAVQVTVVGTVRLSAEGPLGHLRGALSTALLTSGEHWNSLGIPVSEQTWAIDLPPAGIHTAALAHLAAALAELPLRAVRFLPAADVVTTPLPWVRDFLGQMAATRELLVVLLTPVFLLILFFALATANAVVSGRRTEIAVLRSRGMTPLGVVGFYGPESLALTGAATLAALVLTGPAVRVMGLSAGFLQLVNRPPLPVAITGDTVLFALGAAALTELVSLAPLVRAARLTVATMRQEEATRSPVLAGLLAAGEVGLVSLVGYTTWRLLELGLPDDPLYLALPALALAAAGALAWRALTLLLALLGRLLVPHMPPPLHLALSLLQRQSGRYHGLWLMLVVTAGLGIYGAAFARTLDRDLTALAQYRLGSDLRIRPAWESEVISVDAEGNPEEVIYREPPYGDLQELPGVLATARVQTREGVALAAGTRNLGKVEMLALSPQEFGQTARFLPELTPAPPGDYLNLLARDERAVLVSAGLAGRLGLKGGDRLTARQSGMEVPIVVAGVVPYFPGRLPGDGEFLVGNLEYVQDGLGLLPYDVWLRLAPDAGVQAVAAELSRRGARVQSLEDRRSLIAAGRREPLRLALYATLSAGFVIALLVMALTYLLHVGLALQSRAKELGVLRAMGMASRQVAASLYVEQWLMVGTAAATGLAVGNWAGWAYVPLLRQQPGQQLLPLRVAAVAGERLYLSLGFALALATGTAVVAMWVRRLAINKALRLGEDG